MKTTIKLALALALPLSMAALCLWVSGVWAGDDRTLQADRAPAPDTAAAVYSDTITQYGITWEFDGAYECGQFATGDFWVVGPVTITRITPDFTGGMHGWEVNPTTNAGHEQGFDDEVYAFDAARVPSLPYVAQPGESIVKVVSRSRPPGGTPDDRPYLQTAAVLTVIPSPPPDNGATVFRPPYVGSDKPYYSINDLRTELLPAFASIDDSVTLDDVYGRFRRVQFEHLGGHATQSVRPFDNFAWPNGSWTSNYGGDIGRDEGVGALRLMLDEPIGDKMPALIAYVQYGIDMHHMMLNGQTWPPGGGEQPAHNVAYAFAAVMLDDTDMKNHLLSLDPTVLYNDHTTHYGWNGVSLFGHNADPFSWADFETWESGYWNCIITENHVGKRTWADPYGYIDGGYMPGARYAYCCVAQPWKGQALAVHLMPELQAVWYNPSFLDYVDRWVEFGTWTQPDPCAPFDGNPANQGVTYGPDPANPGQCILDTDPSDGIGRFPELHGTNADGGYRGSAFAGAMWDAYRHHYTLSFAGTPDDGRIYLDWNLDAALPTTATWHIDYEGTVGDQAPPFTVLSTTHAYTLTGLANYTWYTVTLSAPVQHAGWLSETVRVMVTDRFTYLPCVMKE